jgi:hypothetical protein
VFVISNALGHENVKDWKLPAVSAFTTDEINVVESWVRSGGVLLLIADHAPYSGAAADMAARFGFKFENGFAGSARNAKPKLSFHRSKGELASHPITDGRIDEERVDKITTFSGSAFQFDANSTSLLTFGPSSYFYKSTQPPRVKKDTPKLSLQGWSQGAVRVYGRGRVAVFGEAAMFTSRKGSNGKLNGFSAPGAEDNAQFLRNLFTWLSEPSLP